MPVITAPETRISGRARAVVAANAPITDFYCNSRYGARRGAPGISDFTFGNPQEFPLPGVVDAIRERVLPHNKEWFAYKMSEAQPQAFLAGRLCDELNLPFEAADVALTTGAFAAIAVAFHLLLDAGDEAIIPLPPWFGYEPILAAAKVPFQPWAKAVYDDRQKHELEPHTRCKPSGVARQFLIADSGRQAAPRTL